MEFHRTYMHIDNNIYKFQQIWKNCFGDILARKWTKKPKSHSKIIAVKVKSIEILNIFVYFFWLGILNSHYSTKLYISHGFLTCKYILNPKIGVFRCLLVRLGHIVSILLYNYIYCTNRKARYCLILKFNIFGTKKR